ncbi:MAG TPA: MFS transporter [Streptosporangiaceae bacterium]|nr:MFS transporter [Streptosporangiaceae bacterium]
MAVLPGLRAVLRVRDFRRLYATRLISQCSDGVFQVGLAGYFFFSPEQQTSAAKAAAGFAGLLVPYSLLGPFVGVFIDRWWRRQILVYEPLLRAALVGVVAALLAVGNDGPLFFLAAIVGLGVNRFFLAALSAALPHVVDRDSGLLVTANSLSVTSGTIIAFAGAGVGYLLRRLFGAGHVGTALIMVCAAAAYVAASLAATRLGRERLGPDYDEEERPQTREALVNVVRGLADGVRHVWRRRPAAIALAAISMHRFLYGIWTLMTLLLFRNYFATSAEAGLGGAAVVLGASGVGYFLAAVITPPAVKRIGMRAWITLLLGVAAVAELVLAAPFDEVLFVISGFVLGLIAQGVKICVDTIVQQAVLDAYRGRVFSVYDMLFNVTFVCGAAVAAAAMPANGKSYSMLAVIVAGYALAAALYGLAAARDARTPVAP